MASFADLSLSSQQMTFKLLVLFQPSETEG